MSQQKLSSRFSIFLSFFLLLLFFFFKKKRVGFFGGKLGREDKPQIFPSNFGKGSFQWDSHVYALFKKKIWPHIMRDPGSPIRDRTCIPHSGSTNP